MKDCSILDLDFTTVMDSPSDIDLLLIGKSGSGKSATGNTILRKKAFKSKAATASVTKEVDFDVTDFHGKIIKVVDVPAVGDALMDSKKALDQVLRTMKYAITANSRGYHAFLIVVRFGGRFTEVENDMVTSLKALFGVDFVKRFCILIMTFGDLYDPDDEGMPFEKWVKKQEGVFQDLVQECSGRIVMFNNTAKDDKERDTQITKLLEVVESLQPKGTRYTDENFARARETQHKIIVESKKPIIKEKTLIETSLIIEKLNQAQKIKDPQRRADDLENLIARTENLIIGIETEDRGTGALTRLMTNVKSIKDSVSGEIKSCYTEKHERERISAYLAELRKLDEEIKQNMEKYSKRMQLEEDCKKEMEKQKTEQREAQAKARQEKERREREFKEKRKRENDELKQKLEKMENSYQEIRQDNNKGFFDTVVDTVTWPFQNVACWIF